jgi:hypothetical protein
MNKSPAEFAMSIDDKFQLPPHLDAINKMLIEATVKPKRYIINMPPRHGKSELISKYFPAWYLLNNPEKRVILCSHTSTLAEYFGSQIIEIIENYNHDLDDDKKLTIDKRNRSAKFFRFADHKGSLTCVGAGGTLTGKGADMLIIDDPVKNQEEAMSEVIRDKTCEWFTSTGYSRLEPNASLIIVMTRWHLQDLTGKIIDKFEVVNL